MNKRLLLSISALSILLGPITAYGQAIVPKKDEKKEVWGYVDAATDKWVVKPKFDMAEELTEAPNGNFRAVVTVKGKKGLINEQGKLIGAGTVFDDITPMRGDALLVRHKGKSGVMNYNGIYSVKPEINIVVPLENEGYIVFVNEERGFMNLDGVMVLQPEYSLINPRVPGYFIVGKKTKIGVVSRLGEPIVPIEYQKVKKYGDYWQVWKNDKMGLYRSGQDGLLVECKYEYVKTPVEGNHGKIYPVCKDKGSWGVIDEKGREVIKFKNTSMVVLPSENALLLHREKVGYRLYSSAEDTYLELSDWMQKEVGPFTVINGKVAEPQEKSSLKGLSGDEKKRYQDTYAVRKMLYNQKYADGSIIAVLDKDGNVVSRDDDAISTIDRFYVVKDGDRNDIYDATGVLLAEDVKGTPVRFGEWIVGDNTGIAADNRVYPLMVSNGMRFIKKEDSTKWTLLRSNGIDDDYTFDEIIHEPGTTGVKRDGKWGIMDDSRMLIDCLYKSPIAKSNIKDYYEIRDGKKIGLLKSDGKQLFPTEYDSIKVYKENLLLLTKNSTIGVFNIRNNSWQIPMSRNYTELGEEIKSGQRWVKRDDKWGIITHEGDELIAPIYPQEDIRYFPGVDIYGMRVGSDSRYIRLDGSAVSSDPTVTLNKVDVYHDRVNGEGSTKSINIEYYLDFNFYENKELKLVCQIYTPDGNPLMDHYGDPVNYEVAVTPNDIFYTSHELIPFSNTKFGVESGKQDFLAKFHVFDPSGKEILIENSADKEFSVYGE